MSSKKQSHRKKSVFEDPAFIDRKVVPAFQKRVVYRDGNRNFVPNERGGRLRGRERYAKVKTSPRKRASKYSLNEKCASPNGHQFNPQIKRDGNPSGREICFICQGTRDIAGFDKSLYK